MTSINYDCNVDSLHTTPIKRTGSPSEAPSTKRRGPPTSTGGRSTADRFISNRSAMNYEVSNFEVMRGTGLTDAENADVNASPAKEEYKKSLAAELFGGQPANKARGCRRANG